MSDPRYSFGVARFAAITKHQYLATAYMALTLVEGHLPANVMGTMGVDKRWRLYASPDVWDEWKVQEQAAVLYHEVWHLLRNHFTRMELYAQEHPFLTNAAEDCVAAGSLISMADGTRRAIEYLRPGDQILGVQNGHIVSGHVTRIMSRLRDDSGVELVGQNGTLRSTLDHRVLTEAGYVRIKDVLAKEERSCKVFRLRSRVHAHKLLHAHYCGDGAGPRPPLPICPIISAQEWIGGVAGDHEAAQLVATSSTFRNGVGLRSGDSGWRGDGHYRSSVQQDAESNLLQPLHSREQYGRFTYGLATGTGLFRSLLHKYGRSTVLEDVSWWPIDGDRLHAPTALLGHQAAPSGVRHSLLSTSDGAVSQRQANPCDAPVLEGMSAFEYAVCKAERVVIPKGTIYYDLVTTCHSFIADGFAVHNCEINDDILAEGVVLPTFPPCPKCKCNGGPCTPKLFGLADGKMAEEYYHALLKHKINCPCECHQGGGGDGFPNDARPGAGACGSCASGKQQPWELPQESSADGELKGISDARGDLIRHEVAQKIREACKQAGTVPAGWQLWAESFLDPKVNWRRELAAIVRRALSDVSGMLDFTYRRPNRRDWGDVIMPALRKPVPEVAVVADTSGSMGGELDDLMAEVAGILKATVHDNGVPVLCTDAQVHTMKRVFRPQQVELLGGGGTDMGVGILAASRLKPKPHICVVLTDCYTPWGESNYGMKVIVAHIGDGGKRPPWAHKYVKVE